MANNAFVTVRGGRITTARLDSLLKRLAAARWGEAVQARMDSDRWWTFEVDKAFHVSVELRSPRKISIRPGGGPLSNWIVSLIQHWLCQELNGTCTDEGIPDRWKGDPAEVWDYGAWFKLARGRDEESEIEFEARYREHLAHRVMALIPAAVLCPKGP